MSSSYVPLVSNVFVFSHCFSRVVPSLANGVVEYADLYCIRSESGNQIKLKDVLKGIPK